MVRDQIRDRLPVAFEDRGEQSVKNIARPVRVYALRPEAVAARPTPTPLNPLPAVAPRLSIVVLPFANLGNHPEQQYFVDGITEDLTTDLSRIADMVVISRNTAFTFQGKRVDTKHIGRELCVRFVLEGSVRRLGNRIRVNAQLIDAETDAHLWAERFDGDTSDLFALQDEITSRIANTLGVELIAAEAARPTENPDALEFILRGRAARNKPRSRETIAEAMEWFEHALELDPHSPEAQIGFANVLVSGTLHAISGSASVDLTRADGLVDQALTVSPRNARAHYIKGQVLRGQRRPEEAVSEYETALALDHNSVDALNGLAWCKLYAGLLDEAASFAEQAIRLSPRDPVLADRYFIIGTARLLQSRIDEAVTWLEKARNARPSTPVAGSRLAAAYALKGEPERAAAELAEARRLAAGDLFASIARVRAGGNWATPKTLRLFEPWFTGLRLAGVPEE